MFFHETEKTAPRPQAQAGLTLKTKMKISCGFQANGGQ